MPLSQKRGVCWHFRRWSGVKREKRVARSSEIFIIFTRQTKGWTGGKKDRADRECNNEANIKRKNASGCAKGPLLTHLINMFIASVTSVYRLSGSSDVTGASLTSRHDKTKPSLSDRGKIIARYRPRKARCIPTLCPTMYSRFYLRSASRLFLTKTNKVGGQANDETSIRRLLRRRVQSLPCRIWMRMFYLLSAVSSLATLRLENSDTLLQFIILITQSYVFKWMYILYIFALRYHSHTIIVNTLYKSWFHRS